MKRSNLLVAGLIGGALFFGACQKEDLANKATSEPTSSADFSSENGLLVFSSNEAYTNTLNELAQLSVADRAAWGQQHGVETRQMAFDHVLAAEDKFDRTYFDGLDENLSAEEYEALGKPIKHSVAYQEAISEGLISTSTEEDGAHSFELIGADPGAAFVTNREGLVVIDGYLHQHVGNELKLMPYDGANSIRVIQKATANDDAQGIEIINLAEKATNYFVRGDIFAPTSNSIIWYYASSNERFRHWVYLNSNNGSTAMVSTYYTRAEGEKKLFGKWRRRNSYNPIHSLDGSWGFQWRSLNQGQTNVYIHNNVLPASGSVSGLTSPMYYYLGGSNLAHFSLHPSGSWFNDASFTFYSPIDILNGHWHGAFYGGSSGYNTNYSY